MGKRERHRIRKEEEIREILDELELKSNRRHRLYRASILNDKGYTLDGERPNTDAIAEWMLERDGEGKLDSLLIKPLPEGEDSKFSQKGVCIHRRKDAESLSARKTNRLEEAIAKELFLLHEPEKGVPFKGMGGESLSIVDYQVPVNRIGSEYHSKVDLVITGDDETLISELKGPRSDETLLRAAVEVVTYQKRILVSGERRHRAPKVSALMRFTSNYGSGNLVPAILFFPGTRPWREFYELKEPKRANLRELLEKWGIRFFEVGIHENSAEPDGVEEPIDATYEIQEVSIGQEPPATLSEVLSTYSVSMEVTLLELLRRRFKQVVASESEDKREFDFNGVNSLVKGRYYLKDLSSNLYDKMSDDVVNQFNRGSGSELEGKMAALRSSSAMTYNLFGNGPVTLGAVSMVQPGEYEVTYEYQLATLKSSGAPANIDAFLLGEKDGRPAEIYVEAKMCEWLLGGAGRLPRAYLDAQRYAFPRKDAQVFIEAFDALVLEKRGRKGTLPPRLERYDAFQMMKHLLAIYSEYRRRGEVGEALPEQAMLLNCVWEMTYPEKLGKYEEIYLDRLRQEHEEYGVFAEVARPVLGLFGDLGVNFALHYVPFDVMARWIDMDPERRDYLRRYII